ncbi:MAG TPA: alpha/beta hydrolase, partial [Mycobacteriales bacterium]
RPSGTFNWYRAMAFNLPEISSRRMVTVPTLLLWSDRDDAVDRSGIVDSARWVTAPYRLEIIEGASHWIPEQHPELVAKLVRAHVRANAGD